MCDYSLEGYPSRKAEVGDRLVISPHAHGFMQEATAKHAMAKYKTQALTVQDICLTCLKPGTKLDLTWCGTLYKEVEFKHIGARGHGFRDHVVVNDYPTPLANLPQGTKATVVEIDGKRLTTAGVEAVKEALVEQEKTTPTNYDNERMQTEAHVRETAVSRTGRVLSQTANAIRKRMARAKAKAEA